MSGPSHFVEISEEEFLKEALEIIEKAQSRGIYLRILGALAVYIHSLDKPACINAFRSLGRFGEGKPLFTDLDLIGYSKQRKEITKLFEEMRFQPDRMVNVLFGDRRLIFYHPQNKYHVDVFLNKLEFSHDVLFGEKPGSGRLELDYPTITLADIILEKLQIHFINLKDLIDLIVLFMGHDVSEHANKDMIDGEYIAKVLSDDWGFWYDAITNLNKAKSLAKTFLESGKLTEEQIKIIIERIDTLRKMIDNYPKTKNWEKRAKIGTNKPWYREVEEVVR
ncbi:MAG: hypothetical protein ACP5GU_09140 [Thermoprotei archaeon]